MCVIIITGAFTVTVGSAVQSVNLIQLSPAIAASTPRPCRSSPGNSRVRAAAVTTTAVSSDKSDVRSIVDNLAGLIEDLTHSSGNPGCTSHHCSVPKGFHVDGHRIGNANGVGDLDPQPQLGQTGGHDVLATRVAYAAERSTLDGSLPENFATAMSCATAGVHDDSCGRSDQRRQPSGRRG